ncbi:MAG: hypothetical protein IJW53_04680 [Clostridia bacterium]|nr:hypothetical protein [Clostridia bacterium]
MKKIFSIILLLSFALSLTACGKSEPKEISCEEIIAAYKDAGYSVLYHGHENDTVYNDLGIYCSFEIRDPNNEDNYMYVDRYFTEEEAQAANEEQQFNPILWLFFGVFGEWRWLHTGYYGDLTYSTFDRKMIKPLKELMK